MWLQNASPDVPLDLNDSLDRIAPEGNHYRHLDEGCAKRTCWVAAPGTPSNRMMLSVRAVLHPLFSLCSYDDMPAHVKSSLMGASLDIPLSHGKVSGFVPHLKLTADYTHATEQIGQDLNRWLISCTARAVGFGHMAG